MLGTSYPYPFDGRKLSPRAANDMEAHVAAVNECVGRITKRSATDEDYTIVMGAIPPSIYWDAEAVQAGNSEATFNIRGIVFHAATAEPLVQFFRKSMSYVAPLTGVAGLLKVFRSPAYSGPRLIPFNGTEIGGQTLLAFLEALGMRKTA